MVSLTNSGARISASPSDIQRLAAEFQVQHFIRLPKLIGPKLLDLLAERTKQINFDRLEHKHVGAELGLNDNVTQALLSVLLNNETLFGFVQSVTNCPPIGSFIGRVYRYLPEADHFDEWHDDLIKHRVVALSVNLGKVPYEGGLLQLRDNSTGTIQQITNTGFGDAILFQLCEGLEHRRTAVKGTIAKTAIAGWFRTQPSFLQLLKNPERS